MILIFHIAQEIKEVLEGYTIKGQIQDYRIVLRTNESMTAYLLLKQGSSDIREIAQNDIMPLYKECKLKFLDDDESKEDFYDSIFKVKTKISLANGRRRLDALLDAGEEPEKIPGEPQLKCTVGTFYSYKGGMGRSTTLAAFAMHLALHEGKKVIIIDCDFEAPGFTNFFLENSREENQRQGFVEYMLDKATRKKNGINSLKEDLEEYIWEASTQYSGSGSIRIMPAGNLSRLKLDPAPDDVPKGKKHFLATDLDHYLEGLARLDLSHQDYIVRQFKGLLLDLDDAFSPDVILIDSRTGFSDILGIAAFHLSKLVVGFFRNDAQSMPGLHYFLEVMAKREDIEPVLINAILPQHPTLRNAIYESFKTDVNRILNEIEEDTLLNFPCFPIGRNEGLEILGTSSESTADFIELIKEKDIRDYKKLFDFLAKIVADNNKNQSESLQTETENTANESGASDKAVVALPENAPDWDEINKMDAATQKEWRLKIKKKIFDATKEILDKTDLYAENLDVKAEFDQNRFFFRTFMNDLFNLDKPLIIGSKGTGKSYLYQALQSSKIVEALKARTSKTDNFAFINMIDKTNQIFRVDKFQSTDTLFKNRFWLIYTWQTLMQKIVENPKFSDFQKPSDITAWEVQDDNITKSKFETMIADDKAIIAIEEGFNSLNAYLIQKEQKGKKEYITLLYDQLDEIVPPHLWNDWLPELINFWRFKRYSRIFGKLFLRKDLFKNLSGITNINELENQAINIEWKLIELYSYFFKIVFSDGNNADWFWSLMFLYKDYTPENLKSLKTKHEPLSQKPLEKDVIKSLVHTFFGKEVTVGKFSSVRQGDSYDWFLRNLQNGHGAINLRVFIDLVKSAMQKSKDDHAANEKPVLSSTYYADREILSNPVDAHLSDLYSEKGNIPLRYFFEYIADSTNYQSLTVQKNDFEKMLDNILIKYKEKEGMDGLNQEKIQDMLVYNGIVKKQESSNGTEYRFPYLYKYKLRLRGN